MIDDERALATNILLFFGTIVLAALLMAVFQDPGHDLIQFGMDHTSSEASADGYTYLDQAWTALPWFLALLGFVQLVAASAAEAELQ